MKLLHVENSSGRGGSLKSLTQLWPPREPWSVEALALERHWDEEIQLDVPVTVMPKQSPFKIWRFLQRGSFDMVHINNAPIEAWAVILAAWWEGLPVISHFRSHRPLRKFEKFLARLPEKIIVLSVAHQQLIMPLKSEVLRNPIDDPGPGESVEAPRLGVFSVLKQGKGHDDLIRALSRLDEPWELWIVGGAVSDQPSTQKDLEALASKLGVSDRIRFWGHVESATDLMKQCRVVVDPSQKAEGLRRTISEGALTRRLVVATDVGGARDLIDTQWLVPPGNIEALSTCCQRALQQPWDEHHPGKALREKALNLFDTKTCRRHFWDLVDFLMGRAS